MRRLANNTTQQQRHPALRFINSTDFIGKLATGIILFGINIYNFNEIIQHWWINALLWLSMFLWPFAKRMADDLLLSIVLGACLKSWWWRRWIRCPLLVCTGPPDATARDGLFLLSQL